MTKDKFLSSTNFSFKDKRVIIRIDCDVDLKAENNLLIVDEDFRLKSSLPTIHFLIDREVKEIILLGHIGRPNGEEKGELNLEPIRKWFFDRVDFQNLRIEENLRFNKGEEENNPEFAKQLANLGDVYVNEAFGVSHREHTSIVGVPKLLPSFLGLRFEAEIKTLDFLKEKTKRPLVFVLGGSKKGKTNYLSFLADWSDYLLIGGKIPLETDFKKENTIMATLKGNKRDIDEVSVEKFKEIIKKGDTVCWAGPMGVYEEEENRKGTMAIVEAIAETQAFKIAGGGDTHRVLSWSNLWDKFDFVSVGGGAMLQYLKDNTLPGIEAI